MHDSVCLKKISRHIEVTGLPSKNGEQGGREDELMKGSSALTQLASQGFLWENDYMWIDKPARATKITTFTMKDCFVYGHFYNYPTATMY